MSRYIDADVLYNSVKDNVGAYWSEGEEVKEECLNEIDNAPTADVVEVVRCKDCKSWIADDIGRRYCELIDCWTGDSDYCSRGERKDDGT